MERRYAKKFIVLHHSLTARDRTSFEAVDGHHQRQWDFRSSLGRYCGYHYFIDGKGKVTQARADWEAGAHCKEARKNQDGLGICLAGNFDEEQPSRQQLASLAKLVKDLMAKHGIPRNGLKFHRDYAAYKSCPGTNIRTDIWKAII